MKVWLCPKCVPDEEFEELTVRLLTRAPCHNCGEWIERGKARCVYYHAWEQWVKEGKIPKHGCSRCVNTDVLADTEDWKKPLCYDCWHAMGEPKDEPADESPEPYTGPFPPAEQY